MNGDFKYFCGTKAENYYLANVLPDYHKFKIDMIVSYFYDPVFMRRWMYQSRVSLGPGVNMESP